MREWEKRLLKIKKEKFIRIAGRIVEPGLERKPQVDFSPTFMKKIKRKQRK